MDNPIIEEKLKVFVSSAMGAENGSSSEEVFKWLDFREAVRKELDKCPYIQAFTIEQHTNEIDSTSYMLYKVEDSDIVVLLIKNEFRVGTSLEYNQCCKNKKPLLVFFFGDENANKDVITLRKELRDKNFCTYRNMADFENAEKSIANDVIQNVIVYYRYHHHIIPVANPIDIDGTPVETESDYDSYIPTKTVLSQFKTSYNSIYKYIGLSSHSVPIDDSEKSDLHDIGEKVIRWVMNGDRFLSDDIKSKLITSVTSFYPSTDWYLKRLDAIEYFIRGDIYKAYQSEKEALTLAEKTDIPKWIITNILIDLRNLQMLCVQRQIEIETEDEAYQKRIDALDSIVHVPVLDRYLENTYENLMNEEIRRNTASSFTTFYGNKLDFLLSGVESYLFTSLLYGSYTHFLYTRKVFAIVLYRMGKLYSIPELVFSSVKMYLFSEQYNDYIRISNREWNSICRLFILNADELWHQANNLQEYYKDKICIGLLYRIGLYLNETSFDEAETYLLSISSNLPWNISNDYIDCLNNNCCRMKSNNVVKIITTIIQKSNYITADCLSRLILHIDLNHVSNSLLFELCEALKSELPNIISKNGNPQIIAHLVNSNPDVFTVLETLPENGLTGDQKLFYDLNTNKEDWEKAILVEIQNARKQYEYNNQTGVYVEFASNPYELISMYINGKTNHRITGILIEQFFPLCIDVLNSECSLETKDQCVECLSVVLGYFKKNRIEIPKDLIDCINNVNFENSSGYTMTFRSYEGLWCRLIALKILVGVLEKKELIRWCFSYIQKDPKERRALVQSLKTYLQYSINPREDIDTLIISIVFQCCEDTDVYIRATSCECLWYILDCEYAEQAEEKIMEMIFDPAPAIRSRILLICKENNSEHKSLINRITLKLINDANYMIRKQAQELLETNLEI